MPEPELRLLAAAVALEEFAIAELAVAAQSNVHTARSWVNRMRHLLDAHPERKAGRGRPTNLYSLNRDGKLQMRRQLTELQRDVAGLAATRPRREMLYEISAQFELWKTVRDTGESKSALRALQVALRGCWQRLARLDSLGESVGDDDLRQLAEMEAEAAFVLPEDDLSLPDLARWIVGRLQRICDQDATTEFAERSTWLRIETRPMAEKSTAAVLAAPVWADEGWATADVPEETWRKGLLVAERIPVESRLQRVHMVLSETDVGYCENDGEAQAVVRGLTACRGAAGQGPLRDWLSAAKARQGWRDALAPMVVHGLLQSDGVRLGEAVAPFRPVLESGIRQYRGYRGQLRDEAIQRSTIMLHTAIFSSDDHPADQLAAPFGTQAMTLVLTQK